METRKSKKGLFTKIKEGAKKHKKWIFIAGGAILTAIGVVFYVSTQQDDDLLEISDAEIENDISELSQE